MTKLYTIRIKALGNGADHPLLGQYIVSYDAEYHHKNGTYDGGALISTPNFDEATRFDYSDAVLLWKSGPSCKCHCTRADGRPNRPLTAFTVEIA